MEDPLPELDFCAFVTHVDRKVLYNQPVHELVHRTEVFEGCCFPFISRVDGIRLNLGGLFRPRSVLRGEIRVCRSVARVCDRRSGAGLREIRADDEPHAMGLIVVATVKHILHLDFDDDLELGPLD